jgi:hypothetical protein
MAPSFNGLVCAMALVAANAIADASRPEMIFFKRPSLKTCRSFLRDIRCCYRDHAAMEQQRQAAVLPRIAAKTSRFSAKRNGLLAMIDERLTEARKVA